MIYAEVPYPADALEIRDVKQQEMDELDRRLLVAVKPHVEAVLREANAALDSGVLDVRVTRRIKSFYGQTTRVVREDIQDALEEMYAEGWVKRSDFVWMSPFYWELLLEHDCHKANQLVKLFDAEGGHEVYRCEVCGQGWSRWHPRRRISAQWRKSPLTGQAAPSPT